METGYSTRKTFLGQDLILLIENLMDQSGAVWESWRQSKRIVVLKEKKSHNILVKDHEDKFCILNNVHR